MLDIVAERETTLSHESLAIPARAQTWIDQTFLWTFSSLAVMAIAASLSAADRWPAPAGPRPEPSARPAPARPAPGPAPAPLIAFTEPEPGYPVISPFGLRRLPWEEAGRLHKGVDIAAPRGEPVLAAADGRVLKIGVDGGYGRFVEVGHAAGMSTLYGHLSAFEARPGMAVKAGQPIGRIGSTGSSTGSHLHFEIHDSKGRAVNPEMFMGHRFMTRAELPLKAAMRTPRRVRIAYVSFIPPAKEALIQARQAIQAAALEGQMRARKTAMAVVLPPSRVALLTADRPAASQSPAQPAAAAESGLEIVRAGVGGRVHGQILAGG